MDPNTVISPVVENALQFGGGVVKRHVGYFYNYNGKLRELKDYVEMLQRARNRVEHEIISAEMNAEEIEDDVRNWLKRVDEKIKDYESFLCDGQHAKTRCSISFFPSNLRLRYQLGRKATKMAEESKAEELWNKKFDKVSYRVGPSIDSALSNTSYESFTSREKTMKMIMQALEDSTVTMIGVYGVGGVGKTTLVKEVAKIAQEKKLFNMVIMANITRIPDIKKVQGQIAEMLGMRLEEESEIVRADRLRKRLKKEKENTLIILDDLWDGLDLNRLGIPCNEDDDGSQQDVKDITDFGYSKMNKEKLSVDYNKIKNDKLSSDYNKMKNEKLSSDYKGCKILLTSRSKEVLCNQMNVKEGSTFSVGVLNKKEAELLLKKMAGIQVKNSVIDVKVIEIAEMCVGLPIALVSIGRALKNKSSFVWEDVCLQIKRQNFIGGQESIEFSTKLSYDHLKNEQLKYIFLQCARMGNDSLIMDLVKICIGLGLLQGVYTIREARSRVKVLVDELRESSLLVESYSDDRFSMHDIVRDVALSISLKEKHVFYMKNGILDEWPRKAKLESYTAIFLHYCDIKDKLLESIYCPKLEVFHMDSKDDFLIIPDNFFKGMIELRVLILTGVNLSCLPSSIKCLTKLRMLCLERCTLGKNLSIIGELEKLRILTLSGSNIESLPVELGQLDKLQLFDLSNCLKLRVIHPNTISRMNSLEELYMGDNLIQWEAPQRTQSEKASISELRHLNQLRTLEICIPRVVHFPLDLFFGKLDSYKIVIGEFNKLSVGELKIPDKYAALKFLALHLEDGIDIHSEQWIKILFKRVENLLLGELNDVRDVSYELNVEGFPDLKHLSIVNNCGIQFIINSMEQLHPLEAFPKLESMCLYNLGNLEKICGNQLTKSSFCQLKILKIKVCGQLESLFSFSMVKLLTKLETIELCDCDSLKEIVYVERLAYPISEEKDDKIDFPQLRFLTLQSLPAFACLYTNDKMPSISQLWEDQVPMPNKDNEITKEVRQGANACLSLFNEKVSVPKLEWLELSSINIQKIWSDRSLDCFQNLLTLNVTDCSNLKYLLSFSMAGSLVNLQSLFVSGCEMMEEIFRPEDETNIDVFPKLKKMEIICMEKLNAIWQPLIGPHSFHSLDSLLVRECHKLVRIFPDFMGRGFQSLQTLMVFDCQSMENIFDFGNIPQTCSRDETNLRNVILQFLPNLVNVWKVDTSVTIKYNNLQSISVNGGPKLEYLFPLSVASSVVKLEFLQVGSCRGMKEIVAWDNRSKEQAIPFEFPHLITISFYYLFELRSFYRGTHSLEWPSLKKLSIINCNKLEAFTIETSNLQVKPIFSAAQKVIYNLDYMALSLKETNWLQNYVVSVHRMQKLQSLMLCGLKNTEILFWFLHRLPNLESLTLGSCLFKRVWAPASLTAHEKIGVVVQLKELILVNLLLLEEIGFEHNPLLQRVERLLIFGCLKLTSLVASSVSFSYLTYLEVVSCNRLNCLMTSSTAKSLVQLTIMKISFCQMVVEIVAENEEVKGQEIEFKQLKALELVSLPSLKSFCNSEKCDFKFPFLDNLVVSECPQMKKFSEVQSAPKLQKVHVVAEEKNRWYWEGDLNGTIQKIFTDQVSLEYSKYMTLTEYPELKEVRHGKPAFRDNFFRSLKILMVNWVFQKDIVIPSYVLPYLKSLEELHVNNCDAVQVIFDIDDIETKKTKGTVFRLKKLTLKELPNLKLVWNKNPEGIVTFPNLQEVVVKDCGSLTTLFPSSLARNLMKLKTLEIVKCDMLVEIVGKKDTMELGSTERFVVFEFSFLSLLVLRQLPQLGCFYPGRHHLECPVLEGLDVSYCSKLELFTSEFHSHQEALAEGQVGTTPTSQLQQPLFLVQKVVPKLKKLALNEKNIILLSNAHLPLDLLHKLKLCFEGDHEEAALPFDFLKLLNVASLKVKKCTGLEEIFPSQKLKVHDGTLVGLKKIILNQLRDLKLLGFEHPWVKQYSEQLEKLKVIECSSLEKLVHSAVSFINLKELTVQSCERIKCLFTFSTAKSLGQLEYLFVMGCESLKEIVTKEDEGISDHEMMMIFGRLSLILLTSLPGLVCFYSGNATLQFPSLLSVMITACPNMKTFSGGVINAPLSPCVRTSLQDFDFHFQDDLNTIIKMLFHQNLVSEAEHVPLLKFGDQPRLEEIWLGFVPIPSDKCFNNLTSVIVVECESLSIVIPFHLLPFLCNLKEMEVRNCQSVKAIFDVKGIESSDTKPTIPLKRLILNQLPNLEYIWNMNPDGILNLIDLQEVYIYHCPSLKSLFQISVVNHLVILDVRFCARLEEIFAEDESTLKGATKQLIFHCLTSLTLRGLPELKHFYPGKQSLEWPMLKHLDVYHCDKLQLFTAEPPSCQDAHLEDQLRVSIDQQVIFSVEKVFPKLELLSLRKEDVMMIMQGQIQVVPTITKEDTVIGQEQFGAKIAHLLQNVGVLKLQCYHEDYESNILFSSGLLEKLPRIEHLEVICSSFNEIFSSQRPSADCTKVLSKLKGLHLHRLLKLNSIGFEHSWVEPLPKTLEMLEVFTCPCLKILVPSVVSFSNLAYLNVGDCHGLVCLLTSSTAKSLGLLKQMKIWDCQAIQEIVSKEGDNEPIDEEITFGQLNILLLQSLPNLVGFHMGTTKLKFPSLDQVTIKECPQMSYSYERNLRQFIPKS